MKLLAAWPPIAHVVVLAGLGTMAALHHRAPGQILLLEQVDEGSVSMIEVGPALEIPEVGNYAALLADLAGQPLFSTGRGGEVADAVPALRASSTEVVPARSAVDHLEEIRLIGSILHPSGPRALVVARGQPEPLWVGEGDLVAGWTITAITGRSILLRTEADGLERIVKMLE